MTDSKPCVRCRRNIDPQARNCPFCNWNQEQTPPAVEKVPAPVAAYQPPEERSVRQKLSILGGGLLLLLGSFFVGMIINKEDAPKHAPETLAEQTSGKSAGMPSASRTTLIPTNERGGFEQPITSAPVGSFDQGGIPNPDRADATAVSATEYAELAKRVRAERQRPASITDPRSITAPAYVPRPRPAPSSVAASAPTATRSRPIPRYQPLPQMRAQGSARLTLLVGTDGRVKEVEVHRALPQHTARLVAAVQAWRFRPAMENGEPIAAPYSVEISFRREQQ